MLRETKSCEASCPKVAGWPWNRWPDAAGISGRIRVEWVAGCSWNQWPDGCGIFTIVYSDGLHCFRGLEQSGCHHIPIVTGGGRPGRYQSTFKWVNTALGNVKNALTGTFLAVTEKHAPRYLAEFEYRFNRRFDLAAMIDRLLFVSLRTPPMPYRLLKMAEVYG